MEMMVHVYCLSSRTVVQVYCLSSRTVVQIYCLSSRAGDHGPGLLLTYSFTNSVCCLYRQKVPCYVMICHVGCIVSVRAGHLMTV